MYRVFFGSVYRDTMQIIKFTDYNIQIIKNGPALYLHYGNLLCATKKIIKAFFLLAYGHNLTIGKLSCAGQVFSSFSY